MGKNRHSLISTLVCIVVMMYTMFIFYPRYEQQTGESTFQWDAGTYYSYLPSLFIYNDLKTQHLTDSVKFDYDFEPGISYSSRPDTPKVLNYSSGMAVIYLPAFAVAHQLAKPLGYPADGFSKPYQAVTQIFCFLIAVAGLWYFRKLLLIYFSDTVTAITIFIMAIGTNYLNYASVDVILTHSSLFTIYVLLILNTINFYKHPSTKYAISIGLLYGLAVLIRPTEMLAIIIPLTWGLESLRKSALLERLTFLKKNFKYIIITTVCAALVGSIQILYWYYVTGQPIYYSYQFGFFWDLRFFERYLFSFRSGWFIYNPPIFLAAIGLLMYPFKGINKVSVIFFFLLNLYVISAWEIWYYSGIGGRAMIQSYPIVFFPFAVFIRQILAHKYIKWLLIPLSIGFIYFNAWLVYNAHRPPGLVSGSSITRAYFLAVVGRFDVPKEVYTLKDTDELYKGERTNMKLIYENNFENDTTIYCPLEPIEGDRSLCIDAEHTQSPDMIFDYSNSKADWIHAQADIKQFYQEHEEWKMVQFIVCFINKYGDNVKDRMIRINRFTHPNMIKPVSFDIKIPEGEFSTIKVVFWTPGSNQQVLIDNVKLYQFNE